MPYINIVTKEYPLYVVEIQQVDPSWSEGLPLPEGFAEVEVQDFPEITERQYLEELSPAEMDGKWQVVYLVKDFTEEEFQKRQELLAREEELLAQGYSYPEAVSIILEENS